LDFLSALFFDKGCESKNSAACGTALKRHNMDREHEIKDHIPYERPYPRLPTDNTKCA
jgi:hypothetical protein